ncbi:hypothetical protein [Actinoplanes awajinensis]|uniref:Uncharacterized protein n=1 Tax=Actinoplanes awajinensis subsp. mycoplanecinus TaxID=135947 RepID=A0A0X3V9P3_9ACTN|nr:hypothetical protein [Actinoplanes awajinensis]KUL41460.1 hypothetical protein ADL15_04195 [Actinoplanes awajinensis subsp. mycoplanecinus]
MHGQIGARLLVLAASQPDQLVQLLGGSGSVEVPEDLVMAQVDDVVRVADRAADGQGVTERGKGAFGEPEQFAAAVAGVLTEPDVPALGW